MKKQDIEVYRMCAGSLPSINVKVNSFGRGLTPEKLGCSESQFEKAMEYAFTMSQEQFWEDAQDVAKHHLDKFGNIEVHSAGRSGGHLVVSGLPVIKSWDAILVSAWGRFVDNIEADIKLRRSDEVVEEDIRSNHWNEERAELYNFIDKKDGSTIIISQEKAKAIAAGFGNVIRV